MDGTQVIRHEIAGPVAQATQLGLQLAETVLSSGGIDLLHGFKN
jgi:hypothetical protein